MMMGKQLDLLAFGAHPDDVEIGMAGTIAKYVQKGKKVGICDLTKAELSSNGTVDLRQIEASKASDILGTTSRYNLSFPDRGLQYSDEKIFEIVKVIRKTRPTFIFVPYQEDRHPDHGLCSKLVEEAIFSAGIKNFMPDLQPHKVKNVYYYMINGFHKPQVTVDITDFIDKKVSALKCYESQFTQGSSSVRTPLTEDYIDVVVARERLIGKEVNVKYAEGFFTNKPYLIEYF
jgi:bacillithiol biosynthesis deacetylase BshB1